MHPFVLNYKSTYYTLHFVEDASVQQEPPNLFEAWRFLLDWIKLLLESCEMNRMSTGLFGKINACSALDCLSSLLRGTPSCVELVYLLADDDPKRGITLIQCVGIF